MMYGATPGADSGTPPTADRNRNIDYFHSSFVDIVLGGLFGLRGSQTSDILVINPLTNASFAVDNLLYHGRDVAVTYEYGGCPGLCVYVDGATLVTGGALNVSLA